MNITRNFIAGSFIAATGLLLTGCKESKVDKKAETYFATRQDKLKDVLNSADDVSSDEWFYGETRKQAKLDSAAFRDILNATEAVNQSEIVDEFNKIAANNAAPTTPFSKNNFDLIKGNLEIKARMAGADNSDIKNLNEELAKTKGSVEDKLVELQHKTDSIVYRKFFDKYDLLDQEKTRHFESISRRIHP